MIIVKVPMPIEVTLNVQMSQGGPIEQRKQFVSFEEFMNLTILTDPVAFGKTMDDVISCAGIKEQLKKLTKAQAEFDGVGEPPVWEVEEEDFDRVFRAAKTPQAGYNPGMATQLVGFLLALKHAV